MLASIRQELRFGRAIAREHDVSRFVPYTAQIDPHTVQTKDGHWLQVIAVGGLPFETLDAAELDYRKDVRNALLCSLASSRIALYHHVIRRRVQPDLGGSFADAFSAELDRRWRASIPRTVVRPIEFVADNKLTFSKPDAVFRSGNATRDDIPSHLIVGRDVPPEVADFYARMCLAGVYERDGGRLVVNPTNCVDCKVTDVLGPRWTPREGGSGPRHRRM